MNANNNLATIAAIIDTYEGLCAQCNNSDRTDCFDELEKWEAEYNRVLAEIEGDL